MGRGVGVVVTVVAVTSPLPPALVSSGLMTTTDVPRRYRSFVVALAGTVFFSGLRPEPIITELSLAITITLKS